MYQLQVIPINPLGLNIFGSTLGCLCSVIFFIIWFYFLFWIYKDAKRRGSSGLLWVVLYLFLSWIAVIIWLIVRGPIQSNAQQVHHHYHGAPPPAAAAAPAQFCPTCSQPMRIIPQYNRWYCDYCRSYK